MNSTGLCLSAGCVHAASEFLYNIAPNYQQLDPCTNFDAMVCDGFRQRHNLRADQGMVSAFDTLGDDGDTIVRSILESTYPDNSSHSSFSPRNLAAVSLTVDQQNFNDLQMAYNACMSVPEIKRVGVTPLQKDIAALAATFGNTTTSWAEPLLWMAKNGGGSLFSLGVSADDKDPVCHSPTFGRELPPTRSLGYSSRIRRTKILCWTSIQGVLRRGRYHGQVPGCNGCRISGPQYYL
jgi:endothelin-converting enzyme